MQELRRALDDATRRHAGYQARFREPDGSWREQIRMKVDHTARVVEEALALAKKRRLPERDADKLDIWKVIFDMEASQEPAAGSSAELRRKVREREHVSIHEVKSKSDYRLFRLSWVFDLNAPESCAEVLRREYVDRMFEKLPADPEHLDLKAGVTRWLRGRAGEAAPEKRQLTAPGAGPAVAARR